MEKNPLIIAEIGSSHGGDLIKASELIEAAAESGADCIKTQIIFADEILHPKTGNVVLPGGKVPLYKVFKSLERGPDFYENMKNLAEQRGLLFLAAPFGLKSAALLKNLKPQALKIASPELNYTALLEETASWGKTIYLSSGVSTLGDIEEALSTIKRGRAGPDSDGNSEIAAKVCLFHCVTAYPALPLDYNLRVLPHLAGIFGIPVGISDHTLDPVLVPVLGLVLGAAAVEKHFCLSRDDPGLDDKIALDPADFARLSGALRRAAAMEKEAVLEEMRGEYGSSLVEQTLGSGIKVLAPSEKANYGRTNRSIHATRDIAAGEVITPDMIGILRSEKILRPGLPPRWEKQILGRKALQPIPAGEGIRIQDI
jgi:sialic acid synthase SpsE